MNKPFDPKHELAMHKALFAPSITAIKSELVSAGKAIEQACVVLADDLTLSNADRLINALTATEAVVKRIRTRMAEGNANE